MSIYSIISRLHNRPMQWKLQTTLQGGNTAEHLLFLCAVAICFGGYCNPNYNILQKQMA